MRNRKNQHARKTTERNPRRNRKHRNNRKLKNHLARFFGSPPRATPLSVCVSACPLSWCLPLSVPLPPSVSPRLFVSPFSLSLRVSGCRVAKCRFHNVFLSGTRQTVGFAAAKPHICGRVWLENGPPGAPVFDACTLIARKKHRHPRHPGRHAALGTFRRRAHGLSKARRFLLRQH